MLLDVCVCALGLGEILKQGQRDPWERTKLLLDVWLKAGLKLQALLPVTQGPVVPCSSDPVRICHPSLAIISACAIHTPKGISVQAEGTASF